MLGFSEVSDIVEETRLLLPDSDHRVARAGRRVALVCSVCAGSTLALALSTSVPPVPSFKSAINYPDGLNCRSVVASDVDLDGDIDLIVTHRVQSDVSIWINSNGLGAFIPGSSLLAGAAPRIATCADIDGDLDEDLLVVNSLADSASLFENRGLDAGMNWLGFLDPVTIPTEENPHWVDTGDLDLDGALDIVIACFGVVPAPDGQENLMGEATVHLAADSVDFSVYTTVEVGLGVRPISVAIDDLNGDMAPDVVVLGEGLLGACVFLNLGLDPKTDDWLGLGAPTHLLLGSRPQAVEIADMDLDGAPDLVVASILSSTIEIAWNDGAGAFPTTTSLSSAGEPEHSLPVDLNGDGLPEIATALLADDKVAIHENRGKRIIVLRSLNPVEREPKFVAQGDFNGDGRPDLASASSNQGGPGFFSVLLNSGIAELCAADLDGSGAIGSPDLALLLGSWGPCTGPCPEDLDDSTVVNSFDLAALISNWGPCP